MTARRIPVVLILALMLWGVLSGFQGFQQRRSQAYEREMQHPVVRGSILSGHKKGRAPRRFSCAGVGQPEDGALRGACRFSIVQDPLVRAQAYRLANNRVRAWPRTTGCCLEPAPIGSLVGRPPARPGRQHLSGPPRPARVGVRKSCVFGTARWRALSGVFLRPGGLAVGEVFGTAGVDDRRHRQIKDLGDPAPARALGAQAHRLVPPEYPPRAPQGHPLVCRPGPAPGSSRAPAPKTPPGYAAETATWGSSRPCPGSA